MLYGAMRTFFLVGLPLLAGLLGACAPTVRALPTPEESPPDTTILSAEPVDLRIVYIIHGDAEYSYHDSTGKRLFADREAVKQAREVGRKAKRAEVFIFDQKPVRQAFFDMTVKAGNYYHYRAGISQHRNSFVRAADDPYLGAETRLLGRDTDSNKIFTVVVYFGHEIPVTDQKGYSSSDPDREFSLSRFAQGLTRAAEALSGGKKQEGKPFDLVILSSCYGGTPATLNALAPLAKQVVASPAYLHLSFLDTRPLGKFGIDSVSYPLRQLGDNVASQSFEQLKNTTQTEITVGVYELDPLGAFLRSPLAQAQIPRASGAWKDCANDPGFNPAAASRGVKLYYQPPRFGPLKDQATRSAWQCLF